MKLENVKSTSGRLKNARIKAGFRSARSFALASGLSPRTYQKHESGIVEIKSSSMVQYCKLLNISLVWLQTGCKEYAASCYEAVEN